jgi:hypothetical protein
MPKGRECLSILHREEVNLMQKYPHVRYCSKPGRSTAHGYIPFKEPVKASPKADILEWVFSGALLAMVVIAIRFFGL